MRMNYGTQLAFRTPEGAQIVPADGSQLNLTYQYRPYGLPVYAYPTIRINASARQYNVSTLNISVVSMVPNSQSAVPSFSIEKITLAPDSKYSAVLEVPAQYIEIWVNSDIAEGYNAIDLEVYGFIPYTMYPHTMYPQCRWA